MTLWTFLSLVVLWCRSNSVSSCSFGNIPEADSRSSRPPLALVLFLKEEPVYTIYLHSAAKYCRNLLVAVVLLQISLTSFAQKPAPKPVPLKYDLQSETKLKGTIEELKFPEKGKEKESAHLVLKDTDKMIDVTLCPKSFLDDMGISFAKGDEISLIGSKITQDGGDILLAREVSKGDDKLTLRDAKGEPVWNWKH